MKLVVIRQPVLVDLMTIVEKAERLSRIALDWMKAKWAVLVRVAKRIQVRVRVVFGFTFEFNAGGGPKLLAPR